MVDSTQSWTDATLSIIRTIENSADLTIFGDGPASIARLPEALGGDPAQVETLTVQAGGRVGFLETLRAKAHYLQLPEGLIDDLRRAGTRVIFAEASEDAGPTSEGGALVLNAALPRYIADLGADLGRRTSKSVAAPLAMVYQQLCTAWLLAGGRGQELVRVGADAYIDTKIGGGKPVDSSEAFRQAAAAYVAARITAWFDIVQGLSNAIQVRESLPENQVVDLLEGLRAHYNAVAEQRVFGSIGGSPILTPALPVDLRERLDSQLLEELPLARVFEDTPLPFLSHAILTGTAGSSDAAREEQLILEIAQNLVVRAGWGVDPDRDELERDVVSTLHGALEAIGKSGVPDPVAGIKVTPGSLLANIRTALNLGDNDSIGWAQVLAVMQEVFQSRDPFDGLETIAFMRQMPAELPLEWNAVDLDATGDDIDALAADLEADTLFGIDSLTEVPAASAVRAASVAGKIEPSTLLRQALRRSRGFFSKILTPSTQSTGNYVERIIQADYILQHPGHTVLMDTTIWDDLFKRWVPLGGTPVQDKIRSLLVSPLGRAYKPDILDLTSHEVFEIKPFRSVFRGLAQLYLRYLIPLNVGFFGYGIAKAILESIDAGGTVTAPVSTSEKPYLPGKDFRSPRWYPMENGGWVFVMLVAPGVIGYQEVSEIDKKVLDPAPVITKRRRLMDAMAAMIAAAAAAAGSRNVGGQPFTPDDLPELFLAAPVDADAEQVIAPIIVGIAFIAVVALIAASGGEALPILQWVPRLGAFGT